MYIILSTCNSGGYVYCRTSPAHPKANSKGLYPVHRVVMENYLGRSLMKTEDVHHKNENKQDNRVENLEVLSKTEHSKIHAVCKPKVLLNCPVCGSEFMESPRFYRLRKKRNKSGIVFCSRSCASKNNNSTRRNQETSPA